MFSTALIIFRETLEIAMILGVIFAATRGVANRALWISGGFIGGLLGSGLVALFAEAISAALAGMGQEIFNAAILSVAAIVIGWTAVWMRQNARIMTVQFQQMGSDVQSGKLPLYSLALVIGLTMLREGSEIVLFIYGMVLSGQTTSSIILGSGIGLLLGASAGFMLYFGLLKIPARYVMRVTSWLLILLVAGLASQAVGYLTAAGYFSAYAQPVWNSSWLLPDEWLLAKSLHSLIGYTARPSILQLTIYLLTFGTLAITLRRISLQHKKTCKKNVAQAIAVILSAGFLLHAHRAIALDEIYSPNVEAGEISVEHSSNHTFDPKPEKNDAEEHEVVVEYGINDRYLVQASTGFSKEPQDHIRLDHLGFETSAQFFEQGENWLDSGILVAYNVALQSQSADALELKLLMQKDFSHITSTANLGFTQGVGKFTTTGGPDYVFLWNTRYRLNEYLQPGIELQSDFGQSHNFNHYDEQEHYFGPAIYGRLFGHLKYQAAWLAGISSTAAQSAARITAEYEMRF